MTVMGKVSCVDQLYCMFLSFYFYTALFVTIGFQNIFNKLKAKNRHVTLLDSMFKRLWVEAAHGN